MHKKRKEKILDPDNNYQNNGKFDRRKTRLLLKLGKYKQKNRLFCQVHVLRKSGIVCAYIWLSFLFF